MSEYERNKGLDGLMNKRGVGVKSRGPSVS
jgi:hypothetical protein